MKSKLLTILFLTSSIFLTNAAFSQKPLNPMKPKPRGIIQKPLKKVTLQRHIRPERVMKKETRNDHCDEGYVEDCADDDCCPEIWIGDDYADCTD